MEFFAAFTIPFRDPHWARKLIIPGLLGLIPLIGQVILLGFCMSVARRRIVQDPEALPDLDFSTDFKRGFMMVVIGLGYALPVILLLLILSMLLVVIGALFALAGNTDTLATVLLVMQGCFGIAAIVYGMVIAIFTPAAFGHYLARGEQLGQAFRFSEIWTILRKSIPDYLLLILGIVLSTGIAFFGGAFCLVGLVLSVPYSMAISGYLIGQAFISAVGEK